MKIFPFFLTVGLALDSTLLMLMMQQNSVNNPGQARQMDHVLPLLLLDEKISNKSVDNKDLLVLMMMQGNTMGDTNAILPLLLLDDDSIDFRNFFLYSQMLKQGKLHVLFTIYTVFGTSKAQTFSKNDKISLINTAGDEGFLDYV